MPPNINECVHFPHGELMFLFLYHFYILARFSQKEKAKFQMIFLHI